MDSTGLASAGAGSSVAAPTMPFDLLGRALEMLEPNDRALYGRFVCKAAWRRLSQLHHRMARFSLPLPLHVLNDADWQPHLQQAFKQHTFHSKMRVLSGAASSGCKANLELAWGLLRPCLFPELLAPPHAPDHDDHYFLWVHREDAGTAAIRSGHAHLLPWLVQHRCPLEPYHTLEAAAVHCDLVGLQQAWELLGADTYTGYKRDYALLALAKAAAKPAGDAVAKLSWLWQLSTVGQIPQDRQQQLMLSAAEGAATSGNLPVLRWLCEQGLDLRGAGRGWSLDAFGTIAGALRHGHVAVADWLVDEAGCPLPQEGEQAEERMILWGGAARGGSVEAMRWLLQRGVPMHHRAIESAAQAGRLEAVQFLHGEFGLALTEEVFRAAAGSRSLPTATWLLQAGCPMSPAAYQRAAMAGDVGMVRWLVQEAGCPLGQDALLNCVKYWPGGRGSGGDLEQALRVLVGAGGLLPPPSATPCLDEAAGHGDLPLLRYLHEELGIGFGPGTLVATARAGCETVLEWLVQAGCRTGEGQGASDPYTLAGQAGDLATLACLRRLGVPWGPRAYWGPGRRDRARQGQVPLPVLRWLVEQGAPWDQEAVRKGLRVAREARLYNDTVARFEARLAASPLAKFCVLVFPLISIFLPCLFLVWYLGQRR